jgi:hypothetical protein
MRRNTPPAALGPFKRVFSEELGVEQLVWPNPDEKAPELEAAKSGQPVTANNFREDVTVNGAINSSDIGLVQSKSGTALPTPP